MDAKDAGYELWYLAEKLEDLYSSFIALGFLIKTIPIE
jgi:hypothetical protein